MNKAHPFHPASTVDGYGRHLLVQGLTVTDFALQPPTLSLHAGRVTTLTFGPVRLQKYLSSTPEGTRVTLQLSSTETIRDLTVTDPLPGGGEKVFTFDEFAGETTLTYDLPPHVLLTDPHVRWKNE
jgi:hypothetical protein